MHHCLFCDRNVNVFTVTSWCHGSSSYQDERDGELETQCSTLRLSWKLHCQDLDMKVWRREMMVLCYWLTSLCLLGSCFVFRALRQQTYTVIVRHVILNANFQIFPSYLSILLLLPQLYSPWSAAMYFVPVPYLFSYQSSFVLGHPSPLGTTSS
jgi:hypothetical protein